MKLASLYALCRQAVAAWIDDYAPSMGAALAYYTLFSIAPLLLIVISIAGLVFGADAARGQIFAELRELMGEDGAAAVAGAAAERQQAGAGRARHDRRRRPRSASARSRCSASCRTRSTASGARPARAGSGGVWALVRARLLSFGMVLGIGFLLIVSLVASAAVAALGKFSAPLFGGWVVLAERLNFVLSFALVTVTFAMIYKIMPRVRIGWRDVWVGAAVTALLFAIGKFADRPVPRPQHLRLGLRRGGLARRAARLDVLLGADLPARRRVHLGLCAHARVAFERRRERPGRARGRRSHDPAAALDAVSQPRSKPRFSHDVAAQ